MRQVLGHSLLDSEAKEMLTCICIFSCTSLKGYINFTVVWCWSGCLWEKVLTSVDMGSLTNGMWKSMEESGRLGRKILWGFWNRSCGQQLRDVLTLSWKMQSLPKIVSSSLTTLSGLRLKRKRPWTRQCSYCQSKHIWVVSLAVLTSFPLKWSSWLASTLLTRHGVMALFLIGRYAWTLSGLGQQFRLSSRSVSKLVRSSWASVPSSTIVFRKIPCLEFTWRRWLRHSKIQKIMAVVEYSRWDMVKCLTII